MCTVCDRRFLRRGLFKDHMEKHTGVKHYSCPNCDERFSTFTLLRLHINSHGSKYKCDQCGKCFAQSQGLKTHRRSHSGERPFVCATCSKRFTTSFNLARHSRIHSGVKPYVCHMCNRQFRTSGNLHRHMKVHDGEELSQCLVCCCFHPASMMHTTPLQSIWHCYWRWHLSMKSSADTYLHVESFCFSQWWKWGKRSTGMDLFCSPPLPSSSLFVRPLPEGLGCCKLPQRGLGQSPRHKRTCDILSLENRFGGNKTVSMYDSHHKEVAVWFQAGQRSAGMPYQHILSPFQQWFLNVI